MHREVVLSTMATKIYAMTYPPSKIPNIVLPEICSQLSIKSKQVLRSITNTRCAVD